MAVEPNSPSGAPGTLPLSAHPAFAGLVAAWFAILLGIGTLILPAALVDPALRALGVASPAALAAAPLSPVARMAVAALAATIGALIGRSLARRLTARQGSAMAAPRLRDEPARPLSVRDDLAFVIAPPAQEDTEDTMAADRGSPGLAQLVERLGGTLERHRPSEILPQSARALPPTPIRPVRSQFRNPGEPVPLVGPEADAALRKSLSTLRRFKGAA